MDDDRDLQGAAEPSDGRPACNLPNPSGGVGAPTGFSAYSAGGDVAGGVMPVVIC